MSEDRAPSAEESRVRALLAEAGRTHEPLPDDVAVRLDATLAGLVAESTRPPTAPAPRTVVPLRRRLPAVAIAAAVVALTVGGLAAATLLQRQQPTATSSAAGGTAATWALPSHSTPSSGQSASGDALRGRQLPGLPQVSSAHFATDVRHLVDAQAGAAAAGGSDSSARGFAASCAGPMLQQSSRRVLVTYDGRPAVLVIERSSASRSLVTAYTCRGSRLASTSVSR